MITIEKIAAVLAEIERTHTALVRARERLEADSYANVVGSRETAAARRASLDLTRALADLRRT